MSFLLDTMTVLWIRNDQARIPQQTRELLRTTSHTVYVSAVSSWEYRHKRLTKPSELPVSFEELMAPMPVEKLDICFAATAYASALPLIHRDPFDRMLIALALHHDLTIVTSDKDIRRYPVKTLW